jgi:hypothetical protein
LHRRGDRQLRRGGGRPKYRQSTRGYVCRCRQTTKPRNRAMLALVESRDSSQSLLTSACPVFAARLLPKTRLPPVCRKTRRAS